MGIRGPSRETIDEARRLGQAMAAGEPSIRPVLRNVGQYPNWGRFILAHRNQLASSPAFARWDAQLQKLAQQEESLQQRKWASEPADWDSAHSSLAGAIHSAFWHAWESAVGLQQLYHECVGDQDPLGPALRVANLPPDHPGGSGLLDLHLPENLEVRLDDIGLA